MTPIVIENAIPKSYQDSISSMVYSRDFPWNSVHERYSDGTCSWSFSYLANNDGPNDPAGSTSMPACNLLMPVAYTMADAIGKKLTKLLRIRIGLLLPNPPQAIGDDVVFVETNYGGDEAHIDFRIPHYTGLYYVNDCDGDTIIYNEKKPMDQYTELYRSSPSKGKICVFDGEHYHASSKPKNSYGRIVVSYNFIAE